MNKEEFEAFVRSEYRKLIRLAMRIMRNRDDAEDAVQNALAYCWNGITGDGLWSGPRLVVPAMVYQRVKDRALDIARANENRKEDQHDPSDFELYHYRALGQPGIQVVGCGGGRKVRSLSGSDAGCKPNGA